MRKLRILIADDHALVRRGAREVLNSQHGWRVVGEAASGREAVEKAIELNPDIFIVDITMPDLDGIEVTRRVREAAPDIKILVLTMDESDQMVRRALEAGARGYVLKSDLTDCLPKAVKSVAEDKRFLTPKVSEIVLEGFLNSKSQRQQGHRTRALITAREIEIIRLLTGGKTNKEIAAQLKISVRTIETHRSNIMVKLGLHTVAELINYALRQGIATAQGS
jgi:DNA-binding NarL/FixJ family response regulator